MANRTVKDAKSIRGTNPQFLIEKIIRSRIYECKYWKEECFALSAELIVDKAMELRYIGGIYGGNIKPTPFLCLTLKMLQIQPEKDIVVEFIKNEEFKYVRALGALYMRLVGSSIECYRYLEPLLNDSRKLRLQKREGEFVLIYMDEFIDSLLHEERLFDIILPRMQKRHVLEEANELEPRISALDDDADDNMETSGDEEDIPQGKAVKRDERKRSPLRKDRERSKERDRKHREGRSDRDREREKTRADREREKHRERSRSRERRHRSRTPERRDRERIPDRREKERRNERIDDKRNDRIDDRRNERMDDRRNDRMDDRRTERIDDRRNERLDDRRNERIEDRRNERVDDRTKSRRDYDRYERDDRRREREYKENYRSKNVYV